MQDPEIQLIFVNRFVVAYNGSRKKHFIYEVRIEKNDTSNQQPVTEDVIFNFHLITII